MQIPGSHAILLDQHLWEPEEDSGWFLGALENQRQRQEGSGRFLEKSVSPVLLLHLLSAMLTQRSLKVFRDSIQYTIIKVSKEGGKWLTISEWALRTNNLICGVLCTEEPCAFNIYQAPTLISKTRTLPPKIASNWWSMFLNISILGTIILSVWISPQHVQCPRSLSPKYQFHSQSF